MGHNMFKWYPEGGSTFGEEISFPILG
uniref:Uncharacterized protein n=1 Tax=Rhizophora mucronata TaxID=61149 RepID=A0A2P2Q960_RHIMU